jgi:hypothetical protein
MRITMFGWTLEIVLTNRYWKDQVVREVNRNIPADATNESMGGISVKISRIKLVRHLGRMFPNNGEWDCNNKDGILSLSDCKRFVEENWS